MSVDITIGHTDRSALVYTNVVGHVLALVVKQGDGSIILERDIAVNADNAADNELVENVVKDIQAKLEEIFPDPNKPVASKLWVP